MLSQSRLVERFSKGALSGSASHLFIEDDIIYSYGHHFPLAVKKDWGASIQYLINADKYSSSTSQHQNLCIRALKPNVQIPFSALAAANLMLFRTIPDVRIVAHRDDEWHTLCKECGREVDYVSEEYKHADGTNMCCEETQTQHVLGAVVLAAGERYFLSSIDDAESWRTRAYFLCELPQAVNSVEEAYDSLLPDAVRLAQCTTKRQGDIFVLETPLLTKEISAKTEKHVRLFDSSHVASEARRVNGTIYVRGTLRHEPTNRRAQHAMLRLGRSWWIAHKNLALGSWNAVGNVD